VAENPFLLPPSSRPTTPATPLVPPSTPPARDPDRYIAIPPSIESATHRIERPENGQHPVAEETQLAASPALHDAQRWSLVLPDGSRVEVAEPIVLGRDPAPPAEAAGARSVRLADPGKTVSKTHVLLRPTVAGARGILVTDLHSTNGVAITLGGTRTVLTPGGDGLAGVGAVIELGSFTVLVDAR
jgi:hypothetical protein